MSVIDKLKLLVYSNTPPHLLVVDDDERLRTLLKKYLVEQGFTVDTAKDAHTARTALGKKAYDLIILDVMMPGETGISLTESLRESGDAHQKIIPILMLTALGEAEERIEGLECGADDYLSKPFEPRELVLRIQKLLERSKLTLLDPTKGLKFGSLTYHLDSRTLTNAQGEMIHLTSAESDLLYIFASQPRTPLSRDELAENSGVTLSPRTIDVQITRLRKKIESDPRQPKYLRTARHKGYALWPD